MGMTPPEQPPYGQPQYPQQPYGQQPQYPQQPYGQPQYQAPGGAGTTSAWGPTSMGLEANVAAGLSYLSMFILGPIIPIVFFFIESKNKFVKFHAAQGILLSVLGVVGFIIVFILQFVLLAGGAATSSVDSTGAASSALGLGSCILGCLYFVLGLAILGGAIWGAIAGFQGKATKLPVIGNFAERMAGGPPTPAF